MRARLQIGRISNLYGIHFELGPPVDIAGITIRPGDAVVGDSDGLIAVDPRDLEAVVDEAEKIVRVETLIFRLLAEGKTFREVLDVLARGAGGG
jgi:regulator of RNase E activity RraA